jgi:hypothetical protein
MQPHLSHFGLVSRNSKIPASASQRPCLGSRAATGCGSRGFSAIDYPLKMAGFLPPFGKGE